MVKTKRGYCDNEHTLSWREVVVLKNDTKKTPTYYFFISPSQHLISDKFNPFYTYHIAVFHCVAAGILFKLIIKHTQNHLSISQINRDSIITHLHPFHQIPVHTKLQVKPTIEIMYQLITYIIINT